MERGSRRLRAGEAHRGRRAARLAEPAALTGALLIYSNALAVAAHKGRASSERAFRLANPALVPLLLAYSAKRAGGRRAIGLSIERPGHSVAWGAAAGAAMAGISVLFFARPVVTNEPLDYEPVTNLDGKELGVDVLLRVPLAIALPEELAFRGLIYSMLKARMGTKGALLWSSVAFGLWHVGVTAISAMHTNLGEGTRLPKPLRRHLVPLAALGGVLTTTAAGAAFGLLREKTGGLAAPLVAHWIADAGMIGALWLMARRRRDVPHTQPHNPTTL